MKSIMIFLLMILTCICAKAQQGSTTTPFLVKPLESDGIKQISARISGGSFYIKGVTDGKSRLEVHVTCLSEKDGFLPNEEIKKRIERDYDLEISLKDTFLELQLKQKRAVIPWKDQLTFTFKIYLNRKVSTTLQTQVGNIEINNLEGVHDFSTKAGNIDLVDVDGKVTGATEGGNINLTNSRSSINLRTKGGNIRATNSSGKLDLLTGGGLIDLSELKGNINVTTKGGVIHGMNIEGALMARTNNSDIIIRKASCNLDVSTSNAEVLIELRQQVGYINADNPLGIITLEIPKNCGVDLSLSSKKIALGDSKTFQGVKQVNYVKGKLNGGGIPVNANSKGGKINIEVVKDKNK